MFKKSLLFAFASLAIVVSAFASQEIPIASAARNAGTVLSGDMVAKPMDGHLVVTSKFTTIPSAATITMTIQAKTAQGDYYDLLSTAATAGAVGTVNVLKLGPGLPATANVSSNEPFPSVFRIKSVLAGSATYSIGVSRTK